MSVPGWTSLTWCLASIAGVLIAMGLHLVAVTQNSWPLCFAGLAANALTLCGMFGMTAAMNRELLGPS